MTPNNLPPIELDVSQETVGPQFTDDTEEHVLNPGLISLLPEPGLVRAQAWDDAVR
ncbi:MAG: hypothetical protein KZQ99_02525 [Candidatus Thiodiazotropha sp. (ex Dulcina madagascariensis)]|nr:hypothetical protein [Candidatus Thiodiazotropha sp. (ex Dulcina madagascariensis)]